MTNQSKKFFYGWWIVFACFMCLFIAYGSRYSFGVFFKPMSKEFGWTRAMTAGTFTVSTILYGLVSPFIGKCVDKFGAKMVIIIGALIAGIGYGLIYFTESIFQFYIFYSFILTIGIVATALVPCNAVTAKWFTKRRATAMGIISIGMGIGPFLLINVAGWMIKGYGWRMSFVLLGVVVFLVISAVSFFLIRNDPKEMGLLPDGRYPEREPSGTVQPAASVPKTDAESWTMKSALTTSTFWYISLCYFFFLFVFASFMVHGVPFATDIGHSAAVAAFALSLLTGCSLGGRLLGGWLGDRFPIRYILAFFILVDALVIAVFIGVIGVKTAVLLYAFMALFGLAYGAVTPLISAVTANAFGAASFGTIYGGVILIGTIGMGIGPVIAGYVYDKFGSYYPAFMGFSIIMLIAMILAIVTKPPKKSALG